MVGGGVGGRRGSVDYIDYNKKGYASVPPPGPAAMLGGGRAPAVDWVLHWGGGGGEWGGGEGASTILIITKKDMQVYLLQGRLLC